MKHNIHTDNNNYYYNDINKHRIIERDSTISLTYSTNTTLLYYGNLNNCDNENDCSLL